MLTFLGFQAVIEEDEEEEGGTTQLGNKNLIVIIIFATVSSHGLAFPSSSSPNAHAAVASR